MELGLRICKHLNATDLKHLYSAIPKWNWILNTWPYCHFIGWGMQDWKWLDRRICQVLLTEDDLICGNEVAAIVHRSEQDAIFQRLSHADFPEHIHRSVRCLYLASTSGTSWLRGNMERYYCDFQVVNSGPPTRIFFDEDIDPRQFPFHWHYSSSASCGSPLQQLTDITESAMKLGKGVLRTTTV